MAEYTIEQLQKLVSEYENWKAVASDTSGVDFARGALGQLDSMMIQAKESSMGAAGGLSGLAAAAKSVDLSTLGLAFDELSVKLKRGLEQTGALQKKLLELSGRIGAVVIAASGKLTMPAELTQMATGAADASAQLSTVGSTITDVASVVPGLGKALSAIDQPLKNLMAASDAARNMQMGMLMSAAAAGELGSMMDGMGNSFENLTEKALQYTDYLHKIADANSITIETSTKYATELKKIPGALDTVVESSEAFGGTMNMLDGVIKVASGTMQSFDDVMLDVNMLFENFNVVGTDSLSFITRMSAAVNALGVPMKFMRSYVKGAAENFKFLGDNSQSALNIMGGFSDALKDSGIGPAAIAQLTGNITDVVSKLDVAQRAFVSGQTGGPGGLAGGYELSYQMQQGNASEVTKQVTDTLKNMMGGSLVSLDDARKDEGAAAQMTKQVQMLTSGPLAIAQDEKQAFAIIDAMNKGLDFSGDMIGGAPQDTLDDAVERGNEIQQLQMNKLTEIHNEAKRIATVANQSVNEDARKLLGDQSGFAAGMETNRQNATVGASRNQPVAGRFTGENTLEAEGNRLKSGAGDMASDVKTALGGLVEHIKGAVGGELPPTGVPMVGRAGGPLQPSTGPSFDMGPGGVAPSIEELMRMDALAKPTTQSGKQAAGAGTKGEHTVIIKTMSNNEVKEIVRLQLQEDGSMSSSEDLHNRYGTTTGR